MDHSVSTRLHHSVNTWAHQQTRAKRIWFALMFLTVFVYTCGRFGFSSQWFVILVLASSLLKGYWIIAEYMGLRQVARKWRWLVQGWLVLVIVLIVIIHQL